MTKEERAIRIWLNKQIKNQKNLTKEEKLFALSVLLEFKRRDGEIK